MLENKPSIGLTWEPKLPSLSSVTKCWFERLQNIHGSAVWKPNSELVDGLFVPSKDPKKLNKLLRKQVKDTAGKNWFEMPAPTITPEIKKDLQILKVGTVAESASDFFSGRLTKKDRKATLADELLSDRSLGEYRKRKIREIEEQSRVVGVEKWKIKGRQSGKCAKQIRQG